MLIVGALLTAVSVMAANNTHFLVLNAVIGVFLLITATSFMWCEVEDLGGSLSVKFGPLNIWCGTQSVEIPYAQIRAYRDPQGSCEGCCAYGVGKVNFCVDGGLRQHALCSLCCQQRQIVIEFKEPQSICLKGYRKMTIAVSGSDYTDFIKLLDEKFGLNSTVVV